MPIKLSEDQDKCTQQCAQCGVQNGGGVDILICTRCRWFGYCSKSCQIAHFRVHRPVCKLIHQLYCPPKDHPAISHSHLVVASETHSDVEFVNEANAMGGDGMNSMDTWHHSQEEDRQARGAVEENAENNEDDDVMEMID